MDHQTLGWWFICPSEPVYHIEDCRIFSFFSALDKLRDSRANSQLLSQIDNSAFLSWLFAPTNYSPSKLNDPLLGRSGWRGSHLLSRIKTFKQSHYIEVAKRVSPLEQYTIWKLLNLRDFFGFLTFILCSVLMQTLQFSKKNICRTPENIKKKHRLKIRQGN